MHWRNSDFQIRHFIAGKCHTPDEAYRVLCELREERMQALAHAKYSARKLNWRVRWLRRGRWMPVVGELARIEVDRLDGQRAQFQRLLDAAVHELVTIEECIEQVSPHRRYGHLPNAQAHQACQADEWLAELRWRAENFMLTGAIPADQLSAMRLHPGFTDDLWPHIQRLKRLDSGLPLPAGTAIAHLLEDHHADPR